MASVSEQVISISEEYLGPAAKPFINKISTYHLNKPCTKLTSEDIPELVQWIKVTMGLLTDDRSTVDEYIKRLNKLAR